MSVVRAGQDGIFVFSLFLAHAGSLAHVGKGLGLVRREYTLQV